jgi:hypothetical protein
VLPKVNKLQSNNPRNNYKAKIHKDEGLLGIEFTLNKTTSKFIHTLEKLNLDYVTSFAKFGNVLLGRYQTNWKQVLHKQFPEPVNPDVAKPAQDDTLTENFLHAIDLLLIRTLKKKKPRDRQYNYVASCGDHGIHKELFTSPLDHLHYFGEMLRIMKLLPEGDLPPPNAALQVEWFYMSFHCLDRTEYVRRGRKLSDEMLQTLAKYFESIFLAQISNDLIQKKHDKQLCSAAKRKLRHELEEPYREKLKRLLESQEHCSSHRWHDERSSRFTCNCRPTCYGNCCYFKACCSGYKDSCGDCKAHSEDGQFNKLCHLHGTHIKHSYNECRQNPKNQAPANNNNNKIKKRASDVHYHDGRHHGSNNKLLVSCTSPALSDSKTSTNKSGRNCTPENYHLDSFHIPKKRKVGNVGHKSPENNALVEAEISQDLDDIFDDDVTVDSFLKAFQKDPSLSMCNNNDTFKFKN